MDALASQARFLRNKRSSNRAKYFTALGAGDPNGLRRLAAINMGISCGKKPRNQAASSIFRRAGGCRKLKKWWRAGFMPHFTTKQGMLISEEWRSNPNYTRVYQSDNHPHDALAMPYRGADSPARSVARTWMYPKESVERGRKAPQEFIRVSTCPHRDVSHYPVPAPPLSGGLRPYSHRSTFDLEGGCKIGWRGWVVRILHRGPNNDSDCSMPFARIQEGALKPPGVNRQAGGPDPQDRRPRRSEADRLQHRHCSRLLGALHQQFGDSYRHRPSRPYRRSPRRQLRIHGPCPRRHALGAAGTLRLFPVRRPFIEGGFRRLGLSDKITWGPVWQSM